MATRNVELVREALGMGPGQPELFWGFLDPDIAWDVSDAPGAASVIRGREDVRRFMMSWRYGWEYWRVEPDDFFDAGENVVTIFREGAGGTRHRADVWTLREDRVVRFKWYDDADEALRAVGLSP
jgi:ketosteroid isomerase-like protein